MIRIAIQKNGRLNEESLKLIEDCGINFEIYRDQLKVISKNHPIEIYFLRKTLNILKYIMHQRDFLLFKIRIILMNYYLCLTMVFFMNLYQKMDLNKK